LVFFQGGRGCPAALNRLWSELRLSATGQESRTAQAVLLPAGSPWNTVNLVGVVYLKNNGLALSPARN